MSSINFAIIQYAGGAVPQSSSNFFSAITLRNARPAITNDNISNNGGSGGLQGAIGADMNSFREDDITRGPVIRRANVTKNSLNGIWLLAENSGVIEPTNAVPLPDNPSSLGGSQNYTFFEPLPFVALAVIQVGQELLENTGGNTQSVTNRLYIQPGVMMKFNKGAGIQVVTQGSEPERRVQVVYQRLRRGPQLRSRQPRLRGRECKRPRASLHLDLRRQRRHDPGAHAHQCDG